jgi:hypothetical protein
MSETQETAPDQNPAPSRPDESGGVATPLAVSLGEILEAHHSRFVERIRERERKEQER